MLLEDFMQGLLQEAGLNPNSLANKMNQRSVQSLVARIASGKTKSPGRDAIAPIAAFFKVPPSAFFDMEVAEKIAKQRGWPGYSQSIGETEASYRIAATKAVQQDIHALALDMARALTPFDLPARKAAASLLADLALHPELGPSTAAHLARLLGEPGNGRPPASTRSGGLTGK